MSFYLKFTIFLSSIFISTSLGIFFWNSNTLKTDDKALYFLQNGETKRALLLTQELEKNSTSAKYPLYQAYILRERNQIAESTAALKKSLRASKTGKNPDLLTEIYLNLILNEYLKDESQALQTSLKSLKQLVFSEKPKHSKSPYMDLFSGIEAFSNKDYKKALFFFQKEKSYSYFSPWMKYSFEKQFTPFWINKQIVRCLIEECQFNQANHQIDEMASLAADNEKSIIHSFRAFLFFRQAIEKPNEFMNLQHSALSELSKITDKELVRDELNEINSILNNHLLKLLDQKSWNEFNCCLNSISEVASIVDLESLIPVLQMEIDSKLINGKTEDAFVILQKIRGSIRVKLLYMINLTLQNALKNEDIARLKAYIDLLKPLIETREFDETSIINQIADASFTCLNCKTNKIEKGILLLNFWHSLEKNPKTRISFAKRVITQGELIWHQNEKYNEAIELFKIALNFPENEDQPIILELLERSISSIHQKALNKDALEELIYLVKAVKALKLKSVNIYNEYEKKQQLDDAEVFFAKGYYKQSYKKASFVLELEPTNEKANRMMGFIAYETGELSEALRYFSIMKQPDSSVLETIKLLKSNKLLQPKFN